MDKSQIENLQKVIEDLVEFSYSYYFNVRPLICFSKLENMAGYACDKGIFIDPYNIHFHGNNKCEFLLYNDEKGVAYYIPKLRIRNKGEEIFYY